MNKSVDDITDPCTATLPSTEASPGGSIRLELSLNHRVHKVVERRVVTENQAMLARVTRGEEGKPGDLGMCRLCGDEWPLDEGLCCLRSGHADVMERDAPSRALGRRESIESGDRKSVV